jgi:hypothetical protein
VTILENDKAKFKAALWKYLHRHSTHSVDGFFFCVRMIYNIVFVNCL